MKNAMYDAALRKHGASFLKEESRRPANAFLASLRGGCYLHYVLSGGKQPLPWERAAPALNRKRADNDYRSGHSQTGL